MNPSRTNPSNRRQEAGQGFVEYAIILIFVGIAVVLVVSLMQPAIGEVFSRFVAQAPVAPPSLLNYTPPPTFTSTPTVDPNAPTATNTPIPPTATNTSVPATSTNTSVPPTITNTPSPTPCSVPNSSHTVPGVGSVRIQMEDFRCGGAGVAFFDRTNDGGSGSGSYRSDVGSEGPDLETTTDPTGGTLNVGYTRDGEWIEFEINAPTANSYTFVIRNASQGGDPQVQIRTTSAVSGAQISTGTISFGSTGGWQNWQSTSVDVALFQGRNFVRFNIISGSGNYNYFDIAPFAPTATPTPVTPTATPIPTNTPVPTNTPMPVTLTLYSNASHDGYIRELDSTNTGNPNQTNSTNNRLLVGDNNGSDNEQHISIVSFDTSVIPANATITSVQLRLQQRNDLEGTPFGDLGLGTLYADIGPFNGFSGSYTLEASDFQSLAAATNVISLSETVNDNDWSTGTMGAGNFNLVNRTGFTQFKIHFQFPDNGDGNRDRVRFDSADAGTNNQPPAPELIIIYTVP